MAETPGQSNGQPAPIGGPEIRDLTVESAAKLAATAGVVCYAVGVFTVNSYLWRLGQAEISALKLRFVYTGAIVMLLPLAFYASVRIGVESLKLKGNLPSSAKVRVARFSGFLYNNAITRLILGASYLLFPLLFLFKLEAGSVTTSRWNKLLVPVLVYFVLLLLFGTLHMWVRLIRYQPVSNMPSGVRHSLCLVMTAACSITYMSWFAWAVFPTVPDQFGGIKPELCRLFVTPESSKILSDAGLGSSAGLSDVVPLLYVSDNSVIVRLKDGHVLSIDKKIVSVIETCYKDYFIVKFEFNGAIQPFSDGKPAKCDIP